MWRNLFSAVCLLLAGNAWAGANDVMVDKVWMRESVPGQTSATVQLNLYTTKPARLLSVSSPVATSGEIQVVEKHHGKMQTQTVDSLKLAGAQQRHLRYARHVSGAGGVEAGAEHGRPCAGHAGGRSGRQEADGQGRGRGQEHWN